MKRYSLLILGAVLLATACRREMETPLPPQPARYAEIGITLNANRNSGTRSLIEIDDEHVIRQVQLFAFDPQSGKILVYGPEAGDAAGSPVEAYRTSGQFSWALPLDTPIDIYTIVNWDSSLDMEALRSQAGNGTLTESVMESLVFACDDLSRFREMEEKGMLMTAVTPVTPTASSPAVNIHVRRLYAKYFIEFDLGEVEEKGLDFQALELRTRNWNRAVHYFGQGDKADSRTLLATGLDNADNQLTLLGQGDRQAWVYVPENLQGNREGATSWYRVYRLGSAVECCTFLDLKIRTKAADGSGSEFTQRLYLGADCKTNFDVRRNELRALKVRIHPEDMPRFRWLSPAVTLAPGETRTLYYDTDLEACRFDIPDNPGGTFSLHDRDDAAQTIRISVPGEASSGSCLVLGGQEGVCQATMRVDIVAPTVLTATWTREPSFVGMDARFRISGFLDGETITSVSSDHDAYVASFDGSAVTFAPGCTRQDILVSTSAGRTLTVPASAVMPELLPAGKSLSLSLDGTPVSDLVRYVRPGTETPLTGFNPEFFERYLTLETTITPSAAAYEDLFHASRNSSGDGTGTFSFCTWDISSFQTDAIYGKPAATADVRPPLEGGPSAEINLSVKPATTGEIMPLGVFHDFSLIPDYENIDPAYLARKGYSTSLSCTLPIQEMLTGAVSFSVQGLSGTGLILSDITGSAGNSYSFRITGGYQDGNTVNIRIRNMHSSTTVDIPVASVVRHYHAAVGGVRSPLTREQQPGTGQNGSEYGADIWFFTVMADFASPGSYLESPRYGNWPAEALEWKDLFNRSAVYGDCFPVEGTATPVYKDGKTILYFDPGYTATNFCGIQPPAYRQYYYVSEPRFPLNEAQAHYRDATPAFRMLRPGSTAETDEIITQTRFHVHRFDKLFPDSGGWICSDYSGPGFLF